jgi:hypothetical protein
LGLVKKTLELHGGELLLREQKTGPTACRASGRSNLKKERAMKRLLHVVPFALPLTLLSLFKAFDSLPRAILTLMNVPFALIGGINGLGGLWPAHVRGRGDADAAVNVA